MYCCCCCCCATQGVVQLAAVAGTSNHSDPCRMRLYAQRCCLSCAARMTARKCYVCVQGPRPQTRGFHLPGNGGADLGHAALLLLLGTGHSRCLQVSASARTSCRATHFCAEMMSTDSVAEGMRRSMDGWMDGWMGACMQKSCTSCFSSRSIGACIACPVQCIAWHGMSHAPCCCPSALELVTRPLIVVENRNSACGGKLSCHYH